MSFGVYILRCRDNSYYTGHTNNLEKRIAEHQAREVEGYSSTRLPVALVFAEEFPTREEALATERQIKGWSRKKKEAIMRGDWAEVSRLARGSRPSTSSGRTEFKAQGERSSKLRANGVQSSGRTDSKEKLRMNGHKDRNPRQAPLC